MARSSPRAAKRFCPSAICRSVSGRKTVSEELLASTPVVFVGWDLLYATGKVLINDPLQARRVRAGRNNRARELSEVRLSLCQSDLLTRRRWMTSSTRLGRAATKA